MFAVRLYHFFKGRKYLLLALAVTISSALVYFSTRLKIEEDISKFIPKNEKIDEIQFTLQHLKIKDKIAINLFHTDTNSTETNDLMLCADRLADSLIKANSKFIKELKYKISDELMQNTYSTFYNNLPLFLDDKDYEKIGNTLTNDNLKLTLESDYKSLISPSGVVLRKYIQADPLNITPMVLKKIQNIQFDDNFEINESYIQTKDKKNLLLFLTPNIDPSEHEQNKDFMLSLEKICKHLKKEFKDSIQIEYYGSTPVSFGNSVQVRKDTVFTTTIALVLIIALLFLYFRRFSVILYILAPAIFGALFSLAMLSFIKNEISAIALGAGSIVLGIAINYSLHIFSHFKHENSIKKVISDLALPMLMGCVTTVGAFFSLIYTKSQALHDFGLFAGFSLIGAMLFSIIVLPHLLRKEKSITTETPKTRWNLTDKLASIRLDKNKTVVISALLLSIVFAYTSGKVEFESDMLKMNYQSEFLNRAQAHLEKINKRSVRIVYVIVKSNTLDGALKANEEAAITIEKLKLEGLVKKHSGISPLLPSGSFQLEQINKWNNFWTSGKKDSLRQRLQLYGKTFHFKEDAFEPFYTSLYKNYGQAHKAELDSLKKLLFNDWVNESPGLVTLVNMVEVEPTLKRKVYEAFASNKNVLVFDKQYLTNQFIDIVSSDFTLILTITALLIFGLMLLSHGRIELAVIYFLPMFISWLWILGIMGIFGLKFNIVNIIISTFIFGLGDDYSIFIMDGLSNEYKFGRKNLESYKSSIFLSAATNIIGIGVLIFAEHPALKSIAAITIIGMCTVLFISFIVQPLFYNFLILDRTKKGMLPYTALNLFITFTGFSLFVVGSIFMTVFGLLLFYIIPLPKKNKKYIFHTIIMLLCRFMIYLFVNVKKDILNPLNEKFSKPSIIISNHQSHIDLAFILMLHPKIIAFTNDWVWNSPFYGLIVRLADFYPVSKGYETGLKDLKVLTDQGYSILIFPEGTRSVTGDIARFHKGAFYLSEELKLDILPILLHGTGNCLTKGDFLFKEASLTLKFLPRINSSSTEYGNSYSEKTKNICTYMRSEYHMLRSEREDVDYFRAKLIKNYIFKGPVLEWYCRVKVKMEGNYREFENYIPKKGSVVDIGCGYGFLSLMLGFMSKDRKILGIDYDEEKIGVASNTVSRSEQVDFVCSDVNTFEFPNSDAFIMNDILHYLEPEKQIQLIEKCIHKLNPNGMMIIRDADADKKKRHWGTRYTEFFSTRSGFNKTGGKGLHFSSAKLIESTLSKYNFLKFRVIDTTKLTSNIIFVVQHKG